MSWRERFDMSGPPLPKGAAGEPPADQGRHCGLLAPVVAWRAAVPGRGVVIGEDSRESYSRNYPGMHAGYHKVTVYQPTMDALRQAVLTARKQ